MRANFLPHCQLRKALLHLSKSSGAFQEIIKKTEACLEQCEDSSWAPALDSDDSVIISCRCVVECVNKCSSCVQTFLVQFAYLLLLSDYVTAGCKDLETNFSCKAALTQSPFYLDV